MDLREAQVQLNRPLKFGDSAQIEARDYMNLLEEIRARMLHCRYCGGRGFIQNVRTGKVRLCGCIRNEPPQIKLELGVSEALQIARAGMRGKKHGTNT